MAKITADEAIEMLNNPFVWTEAKQIADLIRDMKTVIKQVEWSATMPFIEEIDGKYVTEYEAACPICKNFYPGIKYPKFMTGAGDYWIGHREDCALNRIERGGK